MRIVCIVVAGTLMLSTCPAQSQTAQPQTAQPQTTRSQTTNPEALTVMTWNLEWFYDDLPNDNFSELAIEKSAPSRPEWDWRRDAVAQCIADVRPTVMAVQEAESRRILWYLTRALARNHKEEYHELCLQGRDHFTEQDVGLLIRPPIDVVSVMQGGYSKRLRSTNQYFDVSKHIMAILEFPVARNVFERVLVINVHFRAKPEAEELRKRQARLINHWIATMTAEGENVILLGDFNTEERGDTTRKESDLGIAAGMETPTKSDDLVDLHLRLESDQRQTHLLDGRQFDRIFCSRSLLEDDPDRPDLVFHSIEVRRDLAIRGKVDDSQEHWESYWEMPQDERDLSDHYPVLATFEVR